MQQQAGYGGRQRPLVMLTHNVQGITSATKAGECVGAWFREGAHVVCVQETWVDRIEHQGKPQAQVEQWLKQAAAQLQLPQLQVWFANNTHAPQEGRGGVAIVLLCPEVMSEPVGIEVEDFSTDGRMMKCSVRWAGHHFVVMNTYWPNTHTLRQAMLTRILEPALAGVCKDRLILTGDFNHVEDADLDRTRLAADGAILNQGRVQEQELAQALAVVLRDSGQDMVDVFRALHPLTRRYSRFQGGAGSRIDRFYAPASLLPHILQSDTCYRQSGSDHLPVRLVIAPKRLNRQGGRRLWRANIAFMQEEGRQSALAVWAGTMVREGLAKTPQALLRWWPTLKHDYKQQIKAHMAEYMAQVSGQPTERAAEQELQAALEEVWEAGERAQPEQFHRVQVARAQAAEVVHASAAFAAATERADWLHHREAPSPALTNMMQPPKLGMRMTALQLEEGQMVTDPQELAEQVAQHFAGVSRQRAVTADAQQQVLAAIAQHQRQAITPDDAQRAGRQVIDEAEVREALRKLPAGRAPGADGLPLEVWRVGDGVWAPLLTKLYTAMGMLEQLPSDYSVGCVVPIHKGGPVTDVARYRPITLLNADYKVLARLLADRYAPAMQGAIGREQSAFLRGREIGDNIAFTQLLAAACDADGLPAGLVSLDIEQAYDSVDREALYAIMRAKGADDGMVRWVRLLLHDTRAMARVSGSTSRPRRWAAGVRQGCPLSPLLYLFVAEALACWLRASQDVGVQVQGERYVSAHHADDTKVFLRSLDSQLVDGLLEHVATFTAATGQRINAAKSCAVPLGALQLDAPNQTQIIPVSTSIVCLGIAVHAVPTQELEQTLPGLRHRVRDPPPPAPHAEDSPLWDRRSRTVRILCQRVGSLSLSAMGRGMAVSGYVTSKLCFHAEHEGLPARYEEEISKELARTVDGRRGRLPGVHSALLPGSPSSGGFGLLPLRQHIAGRHIKWASRLLTALTDEGPADEEGLKPVWLSLAAMLLQRVCPALHPVQTLLLAASSSPLHAGQGRLTGVNDQRLLIPEGPLRRMATALQGMGELHFHPSAQVDEDANAWLQRVHEPAEVRRLAPSLVWRSQLQRPIAQALSPCRPVSVKAATTLMMEATEASRRQLHEAYAEQALASSQLSAVSRANRTRSFMRGWRTVWKVPWENRHKEVLWRLAVNGVAGAGGCGVCLEGPCACGGGALTADQIRNRNSTPLRLHTFWLCPVARDVVRQLQRGLGNRPLAQWNVWLLQPPPGVRPAVWRVVALAALEAMEMGRRALWRKWVKAGRPEAEEERAAVVEAAGQRAAASFWLALHDFARGGRCLDSQGWAAVGPDHPFLAVHVQPPMRPVIRVVMPAE